MVVNALYTELRMKCYFVLYINICLRFSRYIYIYIYIYIVDFDVDV